jgi:hypothetical protein
MSRADREGDQRHGDAQDPVVYNIVAWHTAA